MFNITLGKVVRSIQGGNWGINISINKINVLGFADGLNIIGNNEENIKQNTATLINEAKTIGLAMNDNKTKVMKLLPTNNHAENMVIQAPIYVFEDYCQ